MSEKRYLVIDNDGGSDDAIAVLMALRAPDVEVVAITTCNGNVECAQGTENMLNILAAIGERDVPVYQGADLSLMGAKSCTWIGFGKNGIGNATFSSEQLGGEPPIVKEEHAANALIRLSKQYAGKLDIVALGPLTNLALAARLDIQFASRIRQLVVMGGSFHARGNASMVAEFNVFADPEAAAIVLPLFAAARLTLVGWELSVASAFSWAQYDELTKFDTCESQLIKAIFSLYSSMRPRSGSSGQETKSQELKAATPEPDCENSVVHKSSEVVHDKDNRFAVLGTGIEVANWIFCDGLAMACYLDQSIVLRAEDHYCACELSGQYSRGQLCVDWNDQLPETKNARIVLKADVARLFDMLFDMVRPKQLQLQN